MSISLRFHRLNLSLHDSGVVLIDNHATLVVADLHLEKGSHMGQRGRVVPPLDSFDTLQRLRQAIDRHKPARVICLGDSFHDLGAGARMAKDDIEALVSLCRQVEEWIWLSGNHDPALPDFCSGRKLDVFDIEGVMFRHQPGSSGAQPQIIGHFHPKTTVRTDQHSISGRCFSVSERCLIMPAFGAYTGGLNCDAAAIRQAHGERPSRQYMIKRGKIWPLA